MDNSVKELESITRLMEVAEESLKQINARLALLHSSQRNRHGNMEELQLKATFLRNNLDDLKEKHQLLTYSHSRNG